MSTEPISVDADNTCIYTHCVPQSIPGLEETQRCLCLAARRHARAVTRRFEDELRTVGLRATQFSVLAALAQMGESTVTPLADLLGVERTTLTRSVDLLLDRGLLEELATADRRQRALRLTQAGHTLLARAVPVWRRVQASLEAEAASGGNAPNGANANAPRTGGKGRYA